MKLFNNYGLRISILLYLFLHIYTAFNEQSFLEQILPIFGLAIILFAVLSTPLTDFKLPIFILAIAISILLFSCSVIVIGLLSCMTDFPDVIVLFVVFA